MNYGLPSLFTPRFHVKTWRVNVPRDWINCAARTELATTEALRTCATAPKAGKDPTAIAPLIIANRRHVGSYRFHLLYRIAYLYPRLCFCFLVLTSQVD